MNLNRVSFKFDSSYEIYGNVPLQKAELVIVTDVPIHVRNRNAAAFLINKIWNNHLILVEQSPYRQVIQPNENSLTRDLSVKKTVIKGWDFPKLCQILKQIETDEEQLHVLVDKLKKAIQNGKLRSFLSEKNTFMELMECSAKGKEGHEILKLLETLPTGLFIQRVYSAIEGVFANLKKGLIDLHKNAFPVRQQLLYQSIEEGLQSYKKVLVYLNSNHVIRNPHLQDREYDIEFMTNYIHSKKFVIINIKNSPLRLPANMPELWKVRKFGFAKVKIKNKQKVKIESQQKEEDGEDQFVSHKEITTAQEKKGCRTGCTVN